jgi:hypothetical protein
MYWPEQLPKGREVYHGKDELIASNHMEVLDVTTFAGKASVEQWYEEDDDVVKSDMLWRQTFDHRDGGKLSVSQPVTCQPSDSHSP